MPRLLKHCRIEASTKSYCWLASTTSRSLKQRTAQSPQRKSGDFGCHHVWRKSSGLVDCYCRWSGYRADCHLFSCGLHSAVPSKQPQSTQAPCVLLRRSPKKNWQDKISMQNAMRVKLPIGFTRSPVRARSGHTQLISSDGINGVGKGPMHGGCCYYNSQRDPTPKPFRAPKVISSIFCLSRCLHEIAVPTVQMGDRVHQWMYWYHKVWWEVSVSLKL